jgi:F420-non-reducing hydrogenase large subunit
MSRITIDPVTRLEGHGKIEIFLGEDGSAEHAFFQVPELRGFEKFVQGRPVEDMPQITSRICGVCPTAHHMAATKALDALYRAEPPPAAKIIRELIYSAFMAEDHALHLFFLGGPDFIVGPRAPAAERNILGVIGKVGEETARKVIAMRRQLREIIALAGGKAIHPVFGLPGGVAKPLTDADRRKIQGIARQAVSFGEFCLDIFGKLVLGNREYVEMILSDPFTHRTYSMGLTGNAGRLNFYDGVLRVTGPGGAEYARFEASRYAEFIAERVEPWSFVKFCYLKPVGWQGFTDGPASGVYAVAPMARLNASLGMATPKAEKARADYFNTLGGPPVHHTLANHWARVIELLYAAERLEELSQEPDLTSPEIRNIPSATPTEGVGVVEAPRGTLIHHYQTDPRGLITRANLIVATQHNSARISMGVEKAAKALIRGPEVPEPLLNMVEMAFRAYDPCYGCASHALPGPSPIEIRLRDREGRILASRRSG